MNPKQQRFVEEYLVDLNATQAAIRAGYSKKTAAVQGHALLKNPKISKAINAATANRSERIELHLDEVVSELRRIAFVDLTDAQLADLPPLELLKAKNSALGALLKHLAPTKHEVKHSGELELKNIPFAELVKLARGGDAGGSDE